MRVTLHTSVLKTNKRRSLKNSTRIEHVAEMIYVENDDFSSNFAGFSFYTREGKK